MAPVVPSTECLELVSALQRCQALVGRGLERRLAAHGVTPGQFELLRLLAEGPLAPSEAASRLGVSAPNVTCVVNNLVRAGHVSRERQQADRRWWLLTLTECGRSLLDVIAPQTETDMAALTAGLSPDEQDFLARLLRKLAASAESAL